MSSPVYVFHSLIVQSIDPDAKYSPFGENTTLQTGQLCPFRVLIRFPFDTLHKPIVWSPDPDAKYSPLGENTKLVIIPECPVSRTREHIQ